jgi:hypothetical protein
MRKNLMRRAIVIGAAACFVLIGAMSLAEAGPSGGHFSSGGFRAGSVHVGGSAFRGSNVQLAGGGVAKFHTNPGGKYIGGGAYKFHTNPGGKYVYRGSNDKFHTNPGGKYVYRGGSGKDDHHHRGNYRRYGYYPWYGLPLYSYGGSCDYLYRRAVATNSVYWWDRYRRCSGYY